MVDRTEPLHNIPRRSPNKEQSERCCEHSTSLKSARHVECGQAGISRPDTREPESKTNQ